MADAIYSDDSTTTAGATTGTDAALPKKKHGRILLAFSKGTTNGGIETMLGTDRLKAAAGAEHAKNLLSVLDPLHLSGPVDFLTRYQCRKVHLYITTAATSPAISWTSEQEDIDPVFSVAIQDIKKVKKVGGLGRKAEMVVGWAMDTEIADGLLIIDKNDNEKQLTAIALRDELFNCLIAMGKQMWESW